MRQGAGHLVVLIVLAGSVAACGGGSPAPIQDRAVLAGPPAVTAFDPPTVPSEIVTPVTVTGTGFAPPGALATLRLEAVSGTPFFGGTQATLELVATIESSSRVRATTVACGVGGTAPLRAVVVLPDAREVVSPEAITTVQGPTLASFSPGRAIQHCPETFTLTGTGFGPVGAEVTVRFSALSGAPFLGGAATDLAAPATIVSAQVMEGRTPAAGVDSSAAASCSVRFTTGLEIAALGSSVSFEPLVKLSASDGDPGDDFGTSAAVVNDLAVVGAFDVGTAYVFERVDDVWSEVYALYGPYRYGSAVALWGDTILVGSPDTEVADLRTGAVHVYEKRHDAVGRPFWPLSATLVPAEAASDWKVGRALAIDGDTLVVGSAGGAAFVFVRSADAWTQQDVLYDPGPVGVFGSRVSISGDTAVVSAPLHDAIAPDAGAAYVFGRDDGVWSLQQKLTVADGAEGDEFGTDVGVSGDTVVVGAWSVDEEGQDAGAAYVFRRSGTTWTLTAQLLASDAHSGDRFGIGVSIFEDWILVGARAAEPYGYKSGAAYLFGRVGETWTERAKLVAPDGSRYDSFGRRVSITEDHVLITSDDESCQGAVYVGRR